MLQSSALSGVPWVVLAALGAVLVATIYAADHRIGGVLIFIVLFSMLSYAVAQGKVKGSTP